MRGLGLGLRPIGLAPVTVAGAPAWAQGVDWWRDFMSGEGNMPNPADTHAQTIQALDTDDFYQAIGPNGLVRTGLGLQSVPTRSNSLTYSSDFATNAAGGWGKNSVGVTPNVMLAPNGIVDADEIIGTGGTAQHFVEAVNVINNGTPFTFSVFAKRGTANFIHLFCTAANVYAQFDLATGALVFSNAGTGSLFSTESVDAGNGWWRFSFSFQQNSGALRHVRVYPLTSSFDGAAPTEPAGASFALWGANLQSGQSLFLAPPIETNGAGSTTNGNIQLIPDIDFNDGICGLITVDIRQPASSTTEVRVFEINDGTSDNRIFMFCNTANARLKFLVTIGGITSQSQEVGDWHVGRQTIAFAVANGFYAQRRVGEDDPGKFSASFPPVDRLAFGGAGYTNNVNIYQSVEKFALNFGPQNAASFDAMYARALLAAA